MGRIVETYPLTSEVTNPPVIYALFEIVSKGDGKTFEWTPGDAIQIMPENDAGEVDAILELLGLSGSEPFLPPWDPSVKDSFFPAAPVYRQMRFPSLTSSASGGAASAGSGAANPPPLTVREVLLRHLSLKVHNKEVCNMMAKYITDPAHRAELARASPGANGPGSPTAASPPSATFGSPSSGSSRRDIHLIDLLQQIKESVRLVPFRGFVESLPALQPRSYSITTAPLALPNHIGIAFKVTSRGVCTNWLLRMCELASEQRTVVELPMKLRSTPEFRLPRDVSTPMVLVGPGTGVAPFLSFLAHREALKAAGKAPAGGGGDIHLYFGCRSKYHDFLFQEELEAWERSGVLHGLHAAFSQDANGGAWFGGLYVQDLLRESGPDICRMVLEGGGHVYVCGDASSMARDVNQVLVDILVEFRGMSPPDAARFLKDMAEQDRYQLSIY